MTGVTTDPRAAATEERKVRHTRALVALLVTRPDLCGTYAPADWTVEAMRWSV